MLPRLMQLGAVLNRGHLVERAMEAVGDPLDRPGLTVLITLRMAGQPLRVGEIAARMQVVGPHVTRHLHDLERRGLVRRVTDPDDQRARLIELTAEGAAATGRYMGPSSDGSPAPSPTGPRRTARTSAGCSAGSSTTSPPTWRPSPTSLSGKASVPPARRHGRRRLCIAR